ncbi:contractile injection system tape measure protein [Robbsia andropogonis]|nr:contractile injection system tape measure protein [Robbsia andropogonis]
MIRLKIILRMSSGAEHEVLAECGAIVKARLKRPVEKLFQTLVQTHEAGSSINVTMNLGAMERSGWQTELPSRALSALQQRTFIVRVALNREDRQSKLNGGADDGQGALVKSDPDVVASLNWRKENIDRTEYEAGAPVEDELGAFATFLRCGYFRGAISWGTSSPIDWLSNQIEKRRNNFVPALTHVLEEKVAFSRLSRIVGQDMASSVTRICQATSDADWVLAYLAGRSLDGIPPWGSNTPHAWFETALRNVTKHALDIARVVQVDPTKQARLANLIGQPLVEQLLHMSIDVRDGLPPRIGDMHSMPQGASSMVQEKAVGKDDIKRPPSRFPADEVLPHIRATTALPVARPRRGLIGRSAHRQRLPDLEAIVVTNAGLICLWPLIPTLLALVEFVPSRRDEGAALSDNQVNTAVRAVMVLDYLVWGDPAWQEWRMPMNKVLCGLPQDILIDGDMLEPWRLEKIDTWFSTLPRRLPGLGGCGVSDLRQLFLQRSGRLVPEGEHWRIEVETDASDVLLDNLPWPMQPVVLPWLDEPIHVTWR